MANLTGDSSGNALEITVYTGQAPPNATGQPVILPTAEDHGVLAVDTSGIADPDGIPNVGTLTSTGVLHNFRYRWIRVDGGTETVVGADSVDYRQIDAELEAAGHRVESGRYRLVEADVGKLLKVEVGFFDSLGIFETVTSLPFRPVRELPLPESTLVSNTGQSPSAQATITSAPYRMGFKLGSHGQGYEISGVSIDLAAAPDRLKVSLWMGRAPGSGDAGAQTKLLEFENPPSFKAGLNRFTAPAGAFTYQNLDYFIVLSDFGDSLSIRRTTSDDEDAGGEPGAALANDVGGDSSVLRLAVKGWRRDHGILVSTYGQEQTKRVHQEVISLGDEEGVKFTVGAADRYLIRGLTFSADNTATGGGFTLPYSLRDGTDELFKLISTRQISGINEFTAPQGATVTGGCTTVSMVETCEEYNFYREHTSPREGGVVLNRYFGTSSTVEDEPKATGVTISGNVGDLVIGTTMDPGKLLMAIFGEPLNAMVQNLGQTDNGYVSVGDPSFQVLSQGFTTGSDSFGYRLQGIGINIEGSDNVNGDAQLPGGPTSVSVAVHADSGGKPGAKLFDLVSPTEYAPGHSFFEAPPGTHLPPDTSYVLVWSHRGGHWHRLQRTSSNSEDTGKLTGSGIEGAYYRGVNVGSLSVDSGGNALEFAVYTEVKEQPRIPVPLSWLHIPDGAYPGYQFRALFVTHHAIDAMSNDKTVYDAHVQFEASGQSRRYPEKAGRYTDPVIRRVAEQFKSVVCTATDKNARRNTDMTGVGVPIHWLDGGEQHRDTLVANHYAGFYGPTWETTEYGAYVTGNSAALFEISSHEANKGDEIVTGIWTGCDSTGMAHSDYHLGSAMGMATLGTPGDVSTSNAPIGPTNSSEGSVAIPVGEYRSIYGISPIFTVFEDRSPHTIFSATMTVKSTSSTTGTVTTDNVGFVKDQGSLSSTQFTYDGTSYSITHVVTQKKTVSGSVTTDALQLVLSPLFPTTADSKLVLELDGTKFPLADAIRQANFYNWNDHGLTWSEDDSVEVKLIDLLY